MGNLPWRTPRVTNSRQQWEEYTKLQTLPVPQELYNGILDKNPLTELCNCGNKNRFSDLEKQLNELITSGKIKIACEEIKL